MRTYKDLTGLSFGYLNVIKETDKRIKGAKVWLCRCKCGNYKEVKTDYLQQGWTKSCGCYKKLKCLEQLSIATLNNSKMQQDILTSKFNTLKRSYSGGAKKRKLKFSLNDETLFGLINQPCHYCGFQSFNKSQNIKSSVYSDVFIGINRIDNKLGYYTANCVPCCKICNRAKGSMSYEKYIKHLNDLTYWRSFNVSN